MKEQNDIILDIINNRYNSNWDDNSFFTSIKEILNQKGNKLYKYCKFDQDGYSLLNLENKILYCSKPSKFNDPFDSRIAINIYKLAADNFKHLMNGVDDDFKILCEVFNKKKTLEECLHIIKPITKHLINNIEFYNFLEHCYNGHLCDNKIIDILQQNNNVLKFLITTLMNETITQIGFTNDVPIDFFMDLFSKLDSTQLIINNGEIDIPASCVKALCIDDDVDDISLLQVICKHIKSDKIDLLNDVDIKFNKLDIDLRQLIDKYFYVGCLSENPYNILMWSHYSESHTGFCIEYDFQKIDLQVEKMFLCPIIYSNNRPSIVWDLINNDDEAKKHFEHGLMITLLTKDLSWSYEKEWRILRTINTQDEKASLPYISCVYIGANCEQTNIDKILKITNKFEIPVKRMVVDRSYYKLHVLSV